MREEREHPVILGQCPKPTTMAFLKFSGVARRRDRVKLSRVGAFRLLPQRPDGLLKREAAPDFDHPLRL